MLEVSSEETRELLTRDNVLVFDTETTSFNGVVIQIGWVIASRHGDVYSSRSVFLYTSHPIDKRAEKVHGITAEKLEREGVDASHFLTVFMDILGTALGNGCRLVAHNARFDVNAINRTSESCGVGARLRLQDVFCTMMNSRLRCGILSSKGVLKMPKNEELYTHLFGKAPVAQLHDAEEDARVTLASFVEGSRRGWW